MEIDLAEIFPGEYSMGRDVTSKMAPLVRMKISKSFMMSRTLVTQKQWYAIMRTRPWRTADADDMEAEGFIEHDACPAVCVSKIEVEEFVKKLSKKTKRKYELPTEVQWEYAYRAGTTTRFFWGDDATNYKKYAWCYESGKPRPKNLCLRQVALLEPNPWGLFDMAGMVNEWVRDRIASVAVSLPAKHYPEEATDFWSHEGPAAMLRNGNYFSTTDDATATFKYLRHPKSRSNTWGFRVVCEER